MYYLMKNYEKSASTFRLYLEAQNSSDRKDEVANTHQLKFNAAEIRNLTVHEIAMP